MNRHLCMLLCAWMFSVLALAQNPEIHPCGTPPYKDPWLVKYQQNPYRYQFPLDSHLYIPMSIHLLATDAGTGRFRYSEVVEAMCTLTEDFQGTNIGFYIQWPIHEIDRSDWYAHPDIPSGAEMMFQQNIDSSLNNYFVGDPAGNCGYNLPYAGIAIRKGCGDANSHTWAHEVGHNLSLPHPFLGWEGDVYDYRNPTPERVTYDYTLFKDSLILDTTIIDTALVEYVDRVNCDIAADGFCDTPPDYLSRRWACDNDNYSTQLQKDPADNDFRSDGSLFMSYANDNCQSRFSFEQIMAMRASLTTKRSNYLRRVSPENTVASSPAELIYPVDEILDYQTGLFEWETVENATHYVIQISRLPNFNFIVVDTIVSNPEFSAHQLQAGKTYYWRVKAINTFSFCSPYSESAQFVTSEITAVYDKSDGLDAHIRPNPVTAESQSLRLVIDSKFAGSLLAHVFDQSGKNMFTQKVGLSAGKQSVELNTRFLSNGLYYLQLQEPRGVINLKFIVAK